MAGEAGFRDYEVVDRHCDGARVVSLVLAAADGAPLAPFEPGQFLTFRIPGPDGRPVPRNYSLSGDPADPMRYRISVRREADPATGSSHMHVRATIGARLQATGPKGRFMLDRASWRPVILIAEDIGLTPLIAMAHALGAASDRPALLVHVVSAPEEAIFGDELAGLAARSPNFTVRRLLADAEGAAPTGFDGTGALTAAHLRAWLPIGDYEAYLCGPRFFLTVTAALLESLGLGPERILTETFEPARAAPQPRAAPIRVPAPPIAGLAPERPSVTFQPDGRSIPWDPARRTLLDFAEANGFAPDFSCRNGICGTCRTAVEGPVVYLDDPLEMPEPGHALLCCTAPAGPVTVRL